MAASIKATAGNTPCGLCGSEVLYNFAVYLEEQGGPICAGCARKHDAADLANLIEDSYDMEELSRLLFSGTPDYPPPNAFVFGSTFETYDDDPGASHLSGLQVLLVPAKADVKIPAGQAFSSYGDSLGKCIRDIKDQIQATHYRQEEP